MKGLHVAKFGGTSLADAAQWRKVRAIIEADPRRRIIVVSAPGKRDARDQKITDLLLLCHEMIENGIDMEPVFAKIRERFLTLARELNVPLDCTALLDDIEKRIRKHASRDFTASRGEYLTGKMMAAWLGATYIEPADAIFLHDDLRIMPATYPRLAELLEGPGRFVIPGFYGKNERGRITTFSRGGSDITGSIAARAVHADVYENWTDVSGFFMADPRIVKNPKHIAELTYKELRELAYMGANVLHDEAIFPVRDAKIPIEIRNTNDPHGAFTRIVPSRPTDPSRVVTGIAGRKDFVLFQIEKDLMNKMVGFGRRVLQIFESYGVSYDHSPTGIDNMSVVVRADNLGDKEELIVEEIKRVLEPDSVEVIRDLAIIATVGQGMIHCVGFAGRLCTALAREGINLRIIDLGASEDNMIVGINNEHYECAINAIYREFVGDP
ncbi:MAG: aspartate kinase [bacterium]|nr:aspartate kinase [bacterium]